jgi:hypothetical protein
VADYKALRLSATLSFIGLFVFEVVSLLHPAGANDHQAAFTNYAASADWAAIHLGEFVGMAILLSGLLVLYFALNLSEGAPRWLGFFAAVAAGVTIVLYGVRMAVDGVALKQAVDAWAIAPPEEQAARFASAETIRWLEWGVASYQTLMFGLTLALYAIVIIWTARVSRPIGYLMGLSGLAWLVVGWVFGTQGFAPVGETPSSAAQALLLIWIIWLLIVAWRGHASSSTIAPEPAAARR